MPIELDAIYRPLSDFFVRRFESLAPTSVEFRFDRTPAVFADSDFVIAGRPESAASAALAAERLAMLVDGIPLFGSDGRSVELGPRTISDLYRDQIVGPAVPLAAGEDANSKTRFDTFNRIKTEALARLDAGRAASLLGAGTFHPVQALPAMWWNRTDPQVWTSHRFEVGKAEIPAPPARRGFLATLKRAFTGEAAKATMVDSVAISFDFCVVNLTRSWLSSSFLANQSWQVPGEKRGSMSSNDGSGLPALPVGFVAIKRLRITAPWTSADITNLESSVQFGPFAFDSTVVDGAIGHDGIQVIGWLLQNLSSLPPADDTPATEDFAKLMADNGLTFEPPEGLPRPAHRGDKPIPFVARIDAAGFRDRLARKTPVVVFVSAAWSGPSRQMERVVELLAREHRDEVEFVELESDGVHGTPLEAELELKAVPTFLLLAGGRIASRVIGMAPEVLTTSVDELRFGKPRPTSGQLNHSFLLGLTLRAGVTDARILDALGLWDLKARLASPIAKIEPLLAFGRELSTRLAQDIPQIARTFESALDLSIMENIQGPIAEDFVREFAGLARQAGIRADSIERLLVALVKVPQEKRRDVVGEWLGADGSLTYDPALAPRDRAEALWGVALLDPASFPSTIRRRETLVFFSDNTSGASRALDPIAQAVGALYAPRFQTCELPFFADYPFTHQLGIKIPGTFVLYRDGTEVARSVRPSTRSDLIKAIGIA